MSKFLSITLDLEPDYAGNAPIGYQSCGPERIQQFAALIRKYDIKLTVFVTGQMLEMDHPAIEALKALGAEFGLHSYSHNIKEADSLEEIQKGKAAFKAYFGEAPAGYRAPQGRITSQGMAHLEQEGFCYDSSITPSFWPRIAYLLCPRNPYYPRNSALLELPLATVPFCRLTVSLSWIKLLGWPIYAMALSALPLPRHFIFYVHMSDFFMPETAYAQLPWRWKMVYARNRDAGIVLFEKFIRLMMRKQYKFAYVGEVIESIRQELPPPD